MASRAGYACIHPTQRAIWTCQPRRFAIDRMSVRPLTPTDIPALFHIRPLTRENPISVEQLHRMGITPQSVAASLQASTRGWVWETDAGEVVGFCMADGSTGELQVVALLPAHEGRGIGGQLMQHAERWLAESGCGMAWLTTDLDTTLRAYGFYRHRGWTEWKRESGMLWMQRDLPSA